MLQFSAHSFVVTRSTNALTVAWPWGLHDRDENGGPCPSTTVFRQRQNLVS
jgi:hypothetical protein